MYEEIIDLSVRPCSTWPTTVTAHNNVSWNTLRSHAVFQITLLHTLLVNLGFAFSVTGPIIVMLALGVLLTRRGMLTEGFIDAGVKLTFNVVLPSLLFITIAQTDFDKTANLSLVVLGLSGTLVVFLLMEALAAKAVPRTQDRGVVVQGGYRSNMAIVGLAYCVNAYGDLGLAAASLYLGFVTILYNVLAVLTLSRTLDRQRSIIDTLQGIAKNPLIIGILAALPFAYFEITLPDLLLDTGQYFAQMALPLALLCTGGSLSLSALRMESRNAFIATGGKIFLSPLILTLAAYLLGFRGIELGIVFFMSAAPTASASYVMSRAMGGNAELAANIIGLSTIASIVMTTLGITALRYLGLA